MSEPFAWKIRPTDEADLDLVLGLLDAARWRHQHLDWADTSDFVESGRCLLATEHGLPLACLACPSDPPGVAWIRLFAVASGYRARQVWHIMWRRAADIARQEGTRLAAALSLNRWLPPILMDSGFRETNAVLFLEWSGTRLPEVGSAPGQIRPLEDKDIPAVLGVDQRAFAPLWRHSEEAILLALAQASLATVVEWDGRLVAYQISTSSPFGSHLARLAVDPACQHRGIGRALAVSVLDHFKRQGVDRVTVNTQQDNRPSQSLYHRLGFRETGQVFPVFEADLPPA